MVDVEEAEKGLRLARNVLCQALSRGNDSETGMILNEAAPGSLLDLTHAVEDRIEILDEKNYGTVFQMADQGLAEHFPRIRRFLAPDSIEFVDGELVRILLREFSIDPHQQVQEGGAGLVLVQPRKAHLFR
ncbi:MAG: hypothetical protein ACRCXD_02960 [Luteolibacter sp.]